MNFSFSGPRQMNVRVPALQSSRDHAGWYPYEAGLKRGGEEEKRTKRSTRVFQLENELEKIKNQV